MTKTDRARTPPAGGRSGRKRLPAEVTRAVRAAFDKKATNVVVLDLRKTPAFTDFFILCSGQNARQVKAIADSIEDVQRQAGVRAAHVEGYNRADWILMDFFTVIVHVFAPHTRDFYALERLWGDAERIEMSEEPPKEKGAP
jgi:ribosome-associated protein